MALFRRIGLGPAGMDGAVAAADNPPDVPGVPGVGFIAAASKDDKTGIQPAIVPALGALGLFVICAVIGTVAYGRADAPTFTAAEGLTTFALFYVVAQAAERLVELAAPLWGAIPGLRKVEEIGKLHQAVATAINASVADAASEAQNAATAQANLDQVTANRRVVTFALTGSVAMIMCGLIDIDFLTTSGLKFATATPLNEALRIVVTGLVVGGGSAGLHGLIGSLSKPKEGETTSETTGS